MLLNFLRIVLFKLCALKLFLFDCFLSHFVLLSFFLGSLSRILTNSLNCVLCQQHLKNDVVLIPLASRMLLNDDDSSTTQLADAIVEGSRNLV